MIYVTLGTMYLGFDRLVAAADAVALSTGERVVVQTGLSRRLPERCEYFDFRPHEAVMELQREARVIVAHAGIGAVSDALAARRPFIVVPRLRRYGEHTNDHQVEIAEAVARRGWGRLVSDMGDLPGAVLDPPPVAEDYRPAREPLVAAVKAMVDRVARRKGGGA